MKTVEELAEVAVHDFCSQSDYVNSTGGFDVVKWREDVALTRDIAHFVGHIEFWDCHIAAFEIDESIILIRDEPQRLTIERWET